MLNNFSMIYLISEWSYGIIAKSLILILILSMAVNCPYAQNVHPLSVGDKVPDIIFSHVLNYPVGQTRLSDFRGKLVIIDLWSTTCSSCIASFSYLSSIQKRFKGKTQILLADPPNTFDTEEKIKDAIARYCKRTGYVLDLPVPILDSALNTYFPHKSIPHEIWISPDGILLAITDLNQITENNIRSVVAGMKIDLPIKDDFKFDKSVPLLAVNNSFSSTKSIYHSLLTGYIQGIGYSSDVRKDANNSVTGYYSLNKPLLMLLRNAYPNEMRNLSYNRLIFDVNNGAPFDKRSDTNYLYCYELEFPAESSENWRMTLQRYLREDLNRAFNLTIKRELLKVESYVLVAGDRIVNLHTKYIKEEADLDNQSIKKYVHNWPVTEVVKYLESKLDKPLIEEPVITQNIDLDFPENFDLSDPKAIVHYLKDIGFDIKVEAREMQVAVITDKYK